MREHHDTPSSPHLASPPGGRPARLRWLVPPVVAAVLVGVVGLVPRLAGAQGRPKLAPLSPAALIAKVQTDAPKVSALTGTVQWKPNLGLPDLSGLTSAGSGSGGSGSGGSGSGGAGSAAVTSLATSLLTAPQTAQVFVDGPDHLRIAVAQGQGETGETDLIRNGSDVWLWQSKSAQVTHTVLGAHHSGPSRSSLTSVPGAPAVPPTPQQVASRLLSSLDPSTRVFVLDTAYVAGRPAYELVLAPKSAQSLISDVVIAVDSATGLPLRVQVVSRSSTTPALEIGYINSISFAPPAASNFAFTAPPGATVRNLASGPTTRGPHPGRSGDASAQPGQAGSPTVLGTGWDSIGVIKGVDLTDRSLATLLRTARSVSGSWGSGRLLTTSLADALVLPDGTVLVGAVTPQALESAAGGLR